ncbi:MAG: ComF family protein [Clostridia bacterium]|nr:ComF family protein [Clostridia bacterium]
MTIKEFLSRAKFLISVPTCVGCAERLDFSDEALCPRCRRDYYLHKDRDCSLCLKPIYECSCTNKYLRSHFVKGLAKVYRYTKTDEKAVQNLLIYSLKEQNREDAREFLAAELSASLLSSGIVNEKNKDGILFTSVPRRPRAIVKYGYDHARLLAERIAASMGAEYRPLLSSRSRRAQKKISHEERKSAVRFVYKRGVDTLDLSDRTVIIVDDIVTTGSSMGAAATLIRGLGCRKIYAAAVSIAYPDIS